MFDTSPFYGLNYSSQFHSYPFSFGSTHPAISLKSLALAMKDLFYHLGGQDVVNISIRVVGYSSTQATLELVST